MNMLLDNSPLIYNVYPGNKIAWVHNDQILQVFTVNLDNSKWQLLDKSGSCPHVDFLCKGHFLAYLNIAPQGLGVYRKVVMSINKEEFLKP